MAEGVTIAPCRRRTWTRRSAATGWPAPRGPPAGAGPAASAAGVPGRATWWRSTRRIPGVPGTSCAPTPQVRRAALFGETVRAVGPSGPTRPGSGRLESGGLEVREAHRSARRWRTCSSSGSWTRRGSRRVAEAIRVRELTPPVRRVHGRGRVTFDVREGEIFGFLGPNGAGKTTTIRCSPAFSGPPRERGGGGAGRGHRTRGRSVGSSATCPSASPCTRT
jgi:hypothetical protein